MKILFIGGTGTISMAISKKLLEQGHELYLINRGNRNEGLAAQLPGTGEWNRPREIIADINREEEAAKLLEGMSFDWWQILSLSVRNSWRGISGFFRAEPGNFFISAPHRLIKSHVRII